MTMEFVEGVAPLAAVESAPGTSVTAGRLGRIANGLGTDQRMSRKFGSEGAARRTAEASSRTEREYHGATGRSRPRRILAMLERRAAAELVFCISHRRKLRARAPRAPELVPALPPGGRAPDARVPGRLRRGPGDARARGARRALEDRAGRAD